MKYIGLILIFVASFLAGLGSAFWLVLLAAIGGVIYGMEAVIEKS